MTKRLLRSSLTIWFLCSMQMTKPTRQSLIGDAMHSETFLRILVIACISADQKTQRPKHN